MKPVHFRDFDILVIGECMVEFRCDHDIATAESFTKEAGGADLLVAISAARLGSSVSLVSAIARDPFHGMVRENLLSQGVNLDHVITAQGFNGLYITSQASSSDREYLFHRPGSSSEAINPAMIYDDLVENSKIVYGSSELQSVSKACRHSVFKAFHHAHRNDIMVAYDPNLRLARWSLDDAKESLWSVLPLLDVILPSAPGETKALFGYERPVDVIGFLWDRGVSIVVVKNGSHGCMVGYDGKIEEISIPEPLSNQHNLTLIGSAFNGGFLHGIAKGHDPFASAQFAVQVAHFKAHHPGGIASLPTNKDLCI